MFKEDLRFLYGQQHIISFSLHLYLLHYGDHYHHYYHEHHHSFDSRYFPTGRNGGILFYSCLIANPPYVSSFFSPFLLKFCYYLGMFLALRIP
jgi:hypothetical protein